MYSFSFFLPVLLPHTQSDYSVFSLRTFSICQSKTQLLSVMASFPAERRSLSICNQSQGQSQARINFQPFFLKHKWEGQKMTLETVSCPFLHTNSREFNVLLAKFSSVSVLYFAGSNLVKINLAANVF